MTSHFLNPKLVPNLWADVFLESIITLTANFSSIKNSVGCFFGSYISSYLFFLSFKWNFIVISGKFLWFNPSPICFSFNQNFSSLSTIFSMAFLSYVLLLISTAFISVFHRSFRIFLLSFYYILLTHYLLEQICHD